MTYLFVGTHSEFLASGRPLSFGDRVDESELDVVEDAHLAPSLVVAPDQAPAPVPPTPAPEAPAPEPTSTPEAT